MNSLLLAIYVMGSLGSLRALNFLLVEISTVCIFPYSPFWVYDYNSFRSLSASFWISSRLYSGWISSVAWMIFSIAEEEEMRFWESCLEMLRVSPIYFISFSMRVVIWDYVEGLYRSQLSEFSHGFCGLKNGLFSPENLC